VIVTPAGRHRISAFTCSIKVPPVFMRAGEQRLKQREPVVMDLVNVAVSGLSYFIHTLRKENTIHEYLCENVKAVYVLYVFTNVFLKNCMCV